MLGGGEGLGSRVGGSHRQEPLDWALHSCLQFTSLGPWEMAPAWSSVPPATTVPSAQRTSCFTQAPKKTLGGVS